MLAKGAAGYDDPVVALNITRSWAAWFVDAAENTYIDKFSVFI